MKKKNELSPVYTEQFNRYLYDCNEKALLLPDEFNSALVGVAHQFAKSLAIYDSIKVIKIIMERDDCTEEDARDFFDFNIQGAYVGEDTPLFLDTINDIIG